MKNLHMSGIIAAVISAPILRFAADAGGDTGSAVEEPPEAYDPFAEHPVIETISIEIKKLVLDAGTQPRVSIDDEVVKEYTDIIKEDIKNEQPIRFPAIDVFRDPTGRMVVAEGFHRILAHKAAHVKEIQANIREGSELDALIFSLSANSTHGQPRTRKDTARAVKIALSRPELQGLSNVEIGRLTAVSEGTVRNIRKDFKIPAPTVREVKIRGKKTRMDTSAIGRGKGGGKKAKKAAAKAAKKAGKNGAPAPDLQAVDRDLNKIVNMIGDSEGGKIRKAFHDGSLALTPRDIKEWAALSPKSAKAVAPLVTGGARMKPYKAYEFVASELPEKIQTELHNRALGSPDGVYEFKGDGFKITVTAKL